MKLESQILQKVNIETRKNNANANNIKNNFTFVFLCSDENGRPLSALKHEVSYSDLNLPVEKWLTEDFKVNWPSKKSHKIYNGDMHELTSAYATETPWKLLCSLSINFVLVL